MIIIWSKVVRKLRREKTRQYEMFILIAEENLWAYDKLYKHVFNQFLFIRR